MRTLHTFGCSLTASTGWPNNLARQLGYRSHNHGVPGGDNVTQIRRFKDNVLLKNMHEEDLVVWEVTYLNRLGFRLSHDHHFYTANKDNSEINHNFHMTQKNIVDHKQHIDYVSFNEDWYDVNWYVQNVGDMLTDLLFAIKISNDITDHGCLVWFADNNIFEDNTTRNNFMDYLKDQQVKTVDYDLSLMNWVRQNKYALAPDGMHPSPEVYNLYAEKVLKPRIPKK